MYSFLSYWAATGKPEKQHIPESLFVVHSFPPSCQIFIFQQLTNILPPRDTFEKKGINAGENIR